MTVFANDRARLTQIRRQRRVIRRDEPLERERTTRRRHVGRVDVVLERDGMPCSGPRTLPSRASRSRRSASASALGLTVSDALNRFS